MLLMKSVNKTFARAETLRALRKMRELRGAEKVVESLFLGKQMAKTG